MKKVSREENKFLLSKNQNDQTMATPTATVY